MLDDSSNLKSIKSVITLILGSISGKNINSIIKYSIIERILSKFLFKYKLSDYDLNDFIDYMKVNTYDQLNSDTFLEDLKKFLKEIHKELSNHNAPALEFYVQ